jgi:tetratricopeptide (TPR) repeat protein
LTEPFDVFLCYARNDKAAVRQLGEALKARGLKVWLDDWEVPPGRPWLDEVQDVLKTISSAAVILGGEGEGPWQKVELRQIVLQLVERNINVIPVLLPGSNESALPSVLKVNSWVDLRDAPFEMGIDRLVWGIQGKKPTEPPVTQPKLTLSRQYLAGMIFHLGKNDERIPEKCLDVCLEITGEVTATDSWGIFRLPLPNNFRAGEIVTLNVAKDGWRIRNPSEGKVRIPADLHREIVEIELLPVGSMLFWSATRIEKFIEEHLARSTQIALSPEMQYDQDLSQSLRKWATRYGLDPTDVKNQLEAWIDEVQRNSTEEHQLGLAAFARDQFATAATHFAQSADALANQAGNIRAQREELAGKQLALCRSAARAYSLQGAANCAGYEFEAAIAAYRRASEVLQADQDSLEWAAVQNDLGIALVNLGVRVSGEATKRYLGDGVDAFRRALTVYSGQHMEVDRALTRNNLGWALHQQAQRATGQDATLLLEEATSLYRKALEEITHDRAPEVWRALRMGLGAALREKGLWSMDKESIALLTDSALMYAELSEFETESPDSQFAIQNNLGIILSDLGERLAGEMGNSLLSGAVRAYRRALDCCSRAEQPLVWAAVQNNLGAVLNTWASRTRPEMAIPLLTEACATYLSALEIRTRELFPQEWAETQSNLGNVLQEQGALAIGEDSLKFFRKAESAYRCALEVRVREYFPQTWAMTTVNLGNILVQLANVERGAAVHRLLVEATDAYTSALEVRSRIDFPQEWALTQAALGDALHSRAQLASGDESLQLFSEAVAAYRFALEIRTREAFSPEWARTQRSLSAALQQFGIRKGGADGGKLIEDGVKATRAALEVLSMEDFPQDWAIAQNDLGNGLRLLASCTGEGGLLTEAHKAIHDGLTVASREVAPGVWAALRQNEISILLELNCFDQAAKAAEEILEENPGHIDLIYELQSYYHDHAFDYEFALKFGREWQRRRPADGWIQILTVAPLFSTRRYSKCIKVCKRLLSIVPDQPKPWIVLTAYHCAALLVQNNQQAAREKLLLLISKVAQLEAGFEQGWPFVGTIRFVQNEIKLSHRKILIDLFEALMTPSREDMLSGLGRAVGQLDAA